MKIKKTQITLFAIFLTAVFFRFYHLGSIPQGFFSDEVAVGYNAYSIIKTGRDEFGQFLPMFFKSFGEGKLPLYVYQAVPFILLLGPTELAVRFPGALFGSLTILALYYFVIESLKLSRIKPKLHQSMALVSALFLSLMPWHIHFSRGVFGQESLFWVIFGSFLLLKGLAQDSQKTTFISFLGFACSLLIYHSPKVILPLWIPTILFLSKKSFKYLFKHVFAGGAILVAVWALVTFNSLGMARAKGVSVFSQHSGVSAKLHQDLVVSGKLNQPVLLTRALHNKAESYAKNIAGRYLSHFNPDFLFISGDQIRPRYQVVGQPQVFIIFLPFILIGLYQSIKQKIYLPLILLLIAPLPASMSFETPSTVRALFMTLPLACLSAFGLIYLFNQLKQNKKFFHFTLTATIIVFSYQLISYTQAYFVESKIREPHTWQYPYQLLVDRVSELQDNYDQVIVSGNGGPPYIFFLFYQHYSPQKFQSQVNDYIGETDPFGFIHITGFDKYSFPKQDCPFDKNSIGSLYVCKDNGEGVDRQYVLETIYYLDSTPAFTLLDPELPLLKSKKFKLNP